MATVLLEPSVRTSHYQHLACCPECGRLSYQSDEACRCGAIEKPDSVSQFGEIYSYTTVHHSSGPFVLALVRLSGGPLVTGRIIGADRELKVGLPVELATDGEPLEGAGQRAISFRLRGVKTAVRC